MRLIFQDLSGKYSITERIKGVISTEGITSIDGITVRTFNPETYNILSIKPPDSIADLLKFNDRLLFYIAYENENALLSCRYGSIHYDDYIVNNTGWRSRFIEYEPNESEVLYKHISGEFVTQEIAKKMFFEAAPLLFLDKNKYREEMKKILNKTKY